MIKYRAAVSGGYFYIDPIDVSGKCPSSSICTHWLDTFEEAKEYIIEHYESKIVQAEELISAHRGSIERVKQLSQPV